MEDPCKTCYDIDKRNSFLREYQDHLLEILKDSTGQPLFKQAKDTPSLNEGKLNLSVETTLKTDLTPCSKMTLENKYNELFKTCRDGIVFTDLQGRIHDCNPAYSEMLGYTLDELINLTYQELTPAKWHEMEKDVVQNQFLKKGYSKNYEKEYIRKDGTIFPISINGFLIKDDLGEPVGMWGFMRDLTNQKEMERQIAESEKRYRELYNNSPIALYRTRISDGKLLECNQALVELFGYDSKEEFQTTSDAVERYVNLGDRAALLEKLKEDKRVEGFQTQVRRKNGEPLWVEATAEIFPEQGYMEGAMQDITASKILTKAERKMLRLVIEGKSNKEVARSLGRSVRTIEDHRSHCMAKLGVDNLVDLIKKAKSLRPEA